MMAVYNEHGEQHALPWNLADVWNRMAAGDELVCGFEVELLADYISRL